MATAATPAHDPEPGQGLMAVSADGTVRGRGRSGRPWERMKARVRAEETHCAWCGQPVDQTLDGNHPDGPVVDHLREITEGGDPLDRENLALMHRRCNGDKEGRRSSEAAARRRLNPGRDW